jgi:hypothetical protein
MQGIAEAIKYLYQQFILRDVVAYVTPGTILAAAVLRVQLGSFTNVVAFIRELPKVTYVPIYGFLFITGLGIQNLGEFIKILPEHDRPDDRQRFEYLRRFHRVTSAEKVVNEKCNYGEALERTRERIEVKKYASGNIALAMLISGILLWVSKTFSFSAHWWTIAPAAILVASLIRAQHRQLKNVSSWENLAIDNYPNEKNVELPRT